VSDGNYGFWSFNGDNGLKGKADTIVILPDGSRLIQHDPDNPALLEDTFILYALMHMRQARDDFDRLYPNMDVGSQGRLSALIAANPRVQALVRCPQDFSDALQHREVTEGVRINLTDETRPRNEAVDDRVKP